MKKLLLGAVMAALFITDANGSFLQTKSSKTNVDAILKGNMGNYYKGMIELTNALLVGWADSLSYAAKDPEFKNEKTQLNNASKKLAVVAKFTKSILNRDREKSITSNQTKAVAAANAFKEALGVLKPSSYWKHSGAQLRFSVVVITNALQALAQQTIQFNVSGASVSASEGLVAENGSTSSYNIAESSLITQNIDVVGTSKVSNLLSAFKQINTELAPKATSVTAVKPTIVTMTYSNEPSVVAPTAVSTPAEVPSVADTAAVSTPAEVPSVATPVAASSSVRSRR